MENIDRIYIINLKERTDRWKMCIEQLAKFNIKNYERFDAIRPDLTKINPIHYSKNNMKHSKNYIIGALGCKLSHLQIIKDANEKMYNQILILEDDFLFCDNFIEKYNDIISNIEQNKININMLYLGFSIVRPNTFIDTSISFLKKLNNGHTTHAYILNKTFYDIIIGEINNCCCEIDVCYANIQKNYEIYGIYPCLISQMNSYSNIMERDVDYKKFINLSS
tara:strand:+ start:17777 stop:18442 length:666 start_codon:yes stop_codon:yes gene_type:complete